MPDAPPAPRIYDFSTCLKIISGLPAVDVVHAIAEAFVSFSRGECSVASIQTLGQPPLARFVGHPDAQACIKSAYVNGGAVFVTKVASGGGGLNSGLVLVFSQTTFAPVAIFCDNGHLTELRTAAAGALAAKLFAPPQLQAIAIIGCGVQARWQLRMLSSVIACRRVRAWARRPSQAREFANEVAADGWQVEVASSVEAACRGAGLIVTVTPSRAPLLRACWWTASDEVLVSAIGADAPGKQELDMELVAMASMCVADSRAQCVERGEMQHAATAGRLRADDVVEIGEWIAGRGEGWREGLGEARSRPAGIVVFDSTGVAVQDAKIAELALTAADSTTERRSTSFSKL